MHNSTTVTRRDSKRQISRDIGLEIGSICGKYFLDMDHLHYGYWTEDLPVHFSNVHVAQANYVDFVASYIPSDVRTILDVGCGTGHMARDLQNMEYEVDCISPNVIFAEKARTLLGPSSRVYSCKFEEFVTEDEYDLVLFAESFQYVGAQKTIEKSLSLMRDGGYLLICDYFDLSGQKNGMGGGERWTRFTETVKHSPLEQLVDIDITDATAPTLDVVNDALMKAVRPTVMLTIQLVANRYPWLYRIIQRVYRGRIEKINAKYFSNRMTGENFKKYKSYRLLLYRKSTGAGVRCHDQTSNVVGCRTLQ